MNIPKFILTVILAFNSGSFIASSQTVENSQHQKITIEWKKTQVEGTVEVMNGKLLKIEIVKGKGKIKGNSFAISSTDDVRIVVELKDILNNAGSEPTMVTIRTSMNPFTFFLRDVNQAYPIYIPDYQVVVLLSDDMRSYDQVVTAMKKLNLKSKFQQIAAEPEETFESAAKHTRNQPCRTSLGVSRDIRIFELRDNLTNSSSELNFIRPRNSSYLPELPEFEKIPLEYAYLIGRGQGVDINTNRRLEDGVLPILNTKLIDEDVEYNSTAFASFEKSPLTPKTLMGTDFLVADQFSAGHMFTKEQEEMVIPKLKAEKNKHESTVLYYRCEAVNKSSVPRYAWFKTIQVWVKHSFSKENGFSSFTSGNVFAISKLNGQPLHDEEMAVLLQPDEKAVFEFYLPHSPISKERAIELSKQSFDIRYNECKLFWKNKLDKAAKISVPEKRVNEMIQAGLLHLDLVTYGNEPNGTLAPVIGVYSPIGTESAPIIQFYNSMGLPDIARRSLTFFLDKQHDDGMIQNFGGYMVETGAALWSMGEYFRYTKDKDWVKLVEPKLLKACQFLLQWREDNKKEELKGKGYGMIAGKVADPEDPFHQYMLNAYAYLGISRVAEMLADIDIIQSERLMQEAVAWKNDIRSSLMNSISNSPIVPLGDGSWCPTVPPWTEAIGPRTLHITPESFFSHGTVAAPDALLGPLYLVFCEVLSPDEQVSRMMLDYHSELFYQHNVAFSQPYYSRHDWIQLKLGLINPFLKAYYNTFSALADRETYSFWEHLYQVTAHKTHEEAWFLMATRWMLYLEEGQTLKLLPGIPRKWLEDGKSIELNDVQSYFGPLSVKVISSISKGIIEADIQCNSDRKPKEVTIRIPHPYGNKAVKVTGGEYNSNTEAVTVKSFNGNVHLRIEF